MLASLTAGVLLKDFIKVESRTLAREVQTKLAIVRDLAEQVLLASYLVDPASSHMLVSKIKPCMSKYKPH